MFIIAKALQRITHLKETAHNRLLNFQLDFAENNIATQLLTLPFKSLRAENFERKFSFCTNLNTA